MRGSVTDMSYSADGRKAFVVSGECLCVWDLMEGDCIARRPVSEHRITAAAWNRNVSRALFADEAGVVREWRLDGNARELGRFETGRTSLVSVQYSPDEIRALTLDHETSAVEEWDRVTGGRRIEISDAGERFDLCLYGPDGRTALVAHQPGHNVYHYDLTSGARLKVFAEDYVCYDMCLSADGERLLAGTRHKSNEWRLRDFECLETFTGHLGHAVPSVAYGLDDRQVLTGSRDGSIRLWDRHTAEVLRRWYPHQNHVNRIPCFARWKLGAVPRQRRAAGGDRPGDRTAAPAVGTSHGGRAGACRFSRWFKRNIGVDGQDDPVVGNGGLDGNANGRVPRRRGPRAGGFSRRRAGRGGCKDGSVRVFECGSGKSVRALEGCRGYVRAVAFAGADKVVSAADDGSVRAWDAVTGRAVRTLEGHLGGVLALAVSKDARQLVSGGRDGTVRVWNLATGEMNAMATAHRGWVQSVAFGPDGHVISGGRDGWVVEWDLRDGREARSYAHGDGVEDVLYLPGAGSICLAGQDGRVVVREPGAAAPAAEFAGHEGAVHALAASPDGRWLLSGSADTTALVWKLT